MTLHKIFGFCLALLLASCAHAQPSASDTQLRGQIRALDTTLRVLHITAHPGDEDGALLLSQTHGQGAKVTLLTLTRGERGDNRQGILEPTEQGLLRTMEQFASDAHYGVEQRFTRMVDFGFARTADEVFDRWGGHNAALADMVRVIRETRPEIIVTPFGSSEEDGQHAATAILVREAFSAAADAKKFPEQLTGGVEPWQAKRLFALVHSGGYSVAFNAAETGAGERESWQQQGEHALAEQHSQEGLSHAPTEVVRRYRLIASARGFQMSEGAKGFAEGLNTSLEQIASAPGLAAEDALQMRSRLRAMHDAAAAAMESGADRANVVSQLAEYLRNLRGVEDRTLAAHTPASLRAEVEEKRKQAEQALLLAADVHVQARLMSDGIAGAAYVLVPGASFAVQVDVLPGASNSVRVAGVELKPEGGRWLPRREWNPGDMRATFRGRVPSDAPFTRPQFLLDSDEDGAYRILDERIVTNALPPPSLQAIAEVEIAGEVVRVSVPVEAPEAIIPTADNAAQDASQNPNLQTPIAKMRTVVVAPPVSVIVEPHTHWNRRTNLSYGEIEVRVRSNLGKLQNALLSVHPPAGWRAEPEHEVLDIDGRGEEHSYRFFLVQERGGEGAFPVRAVVRWGSAVFDQGYTIVRGADDQIAFDYRPSDGLLASADVDVPENIQLGYVGGAGDPIPDTLRDINLSVTDVDREELTNGRLGKYWAIVLGPQVVNSREELAQARPRLLKYVEDGGVVLILSQSDAARFASVAPLPYPVELGTSRVSNEASAVEILEPHDDAFSDPNEMSSEDFRGWTEERGHNFAQSWDAHFEPLLRMNDQAQPVQEGSLIRARYGRGYVIYTGLSFSRQLPAGVPGALRLLVNLLSLNADLHH